MQPAASDEDTRVWIGRVEEGREDDHEKFVAWLNGPEAQEIYRRRRLTEYLLLQEGPSLTVVFRAPHTGDPRIMIDFLRYPGMWPSFWQFARGGGAGDAPSLTPDDGRLRVHWQRPAAERS